MNTVKLKRSASYDVVFPDGSTETMRQIGEIWEGLAVLVDSQTRRLIVDFGTYDTARFIAGLLGDGEVEREVHVIKGAPDLLARLTEALEDG